MFDNVIFFLDWDGLDVENCDVCVCWGFFIGIFI